MNNTSNTEVRSFTIDPSTLRRLNILKRMDERADGNRSEMLRILVNEEWDRRGLPDEAALETVQLVFKNGA